MRKVSFLMATIFVAVIGMAQQTPTVPSITNDEAAKVFATASEINARDGGRLWGMQVCGPMFVVDSESRYLVANQADAQGKLRKSGEVWVGELPKEISAANSATNWAGVKWTMLMWPVTKDPRDRVRLVAHECFHRIQANLKLMPRDAVAGHLDGEAGRTWLQLEWRALERALASTGEERKIAIRDALRFRDYRRSLVKSAPANEDALELNEGLAEYTGFRLANANEADRRAAAIYALHAGPQKQSFGRSFAYVSGPAYGILLDESVIDWRKALTPRADWGALLGSGYKLARASVTEELAIRAAKEYQGETLILAEHERALVAAVKLAKIKKKFVNGPLLVLPVDDQFGYGFDPNDTTTVDENSTVYGWARITGSWGVLETGNGALMVRENGKIVRVVVPAEKEWKLDLKPGWKIVAAGRDGDETLKQQ
jgi:hypothetical protein